MHSETGPSCRTFGKVGGGGGPPHKKEGVGASLAKGEGSSFGPTLKAYLMSQRRIRDPPPISYRYSNIFLMSIHSIHCKCIVERPKTSCCLWNFLHRSAACVSDVWHLSSDLSSNVPTWSTSIVVPGDEYSQYLSRWEDFNCYSQYLNIYITLVSQILKL